MAIIVNNIVTNAIKYSNEKGTIQFEIIETEHDLICSITDAGIGIPKDDLQKIFDQFYRAKSNENPEIKGTGLGLSIVKRLCVLLQIDLKIESEEGNGTRVILGFKK